MQNILNRSWKFVLFLFAVSVLAFCLWDPLNAHEKTRADVKVDKFVPTQELFDKVVVAFPIADWERYYIRESDVTSVELIGFEAYNDGNLLSVEITDPKYLKLIGRCLNPTFMLRPGVSDFALYPGVPLCDNETNSFILVNEKEKQTVIAVSCLGYQLNDTTANEKTLFHSWLLTQTLDDILFQNTGNHLNKFDFDAYSGQRVIDSQKNDYEEITEEDDNE
ncbi:MAG: hypothetical protein CMJ46_12915 [Planctomyces sp.]|nr:hypothetical protein [Planctomyces sp.]